KGLRFERSDLKSFLERNSVQLDFDGARSVVGIEENIDACELTDGAVNRVGLVGHLDGDRDVGDRSEFNRTGRFVDSTLKAGRRPRSLWRRIPLVVDQLLRANQFLLGDEKRRIDIEGLLEFGDGLIELAVFAQFLAAMDDRGSGLETGVLKGGAVAQLFRLQVVSLLVKVIGSFILLAGFGTLALREEVFGLVCHGGEGESGDQPQKDSWAHCGSHSIILTG